MDYVSDDKKKKRKKNKASVKLSFALDDEEEEGEDDKDKIKTKKIKTLKDPTVDTSFLPDRDREEMERIQRELLRQEWLKRQEEIKSKFFTIHLQHTFIFLLCKITHCI